MEVLYSWTRSRVRRPFFQAYKVVRGPGDARSCESAPASRRAGLSSPAIALLGGRVRGRQFLEPLRREFAIGESHVVADARPVQLRDGILARAVHREICGNRAAKVVGRDVR